MLIHRLCNILAAIGQTSVDLFEWQRSDVQRKRLPNNPSWSRLATARGTLPFTGVELAHAVVKADFLIAGNFALPSLGFLFQMDRIIDFGSSTNLRLLAGASLILNDVTQSSLAGRVGQGLSILFAHSKDYAFLGHLASDPSVRSHILTWGNTKVADFIFENVSGDRMLLESKASFSLSNNDPSRVKTVLKSSLEGQVIPWMGRVTPKPTKGFGVYSCLREVGNSTRSSLVFVDPPEQKGQSEFFLPPVSVRRHNYAGWLRAMGLGDAADHLAALPDKSLRDRRPKPVRIRTAKIRGRKFALLTSLDRPSPATRFAIGMEYAALQAVSAAAQGSFDALMAYQPPRIRDDERAPQASIFPDGTFFGLVSSADLDQVEEFLL